MEKEKLLELLNQVRLGRLSPEAVLQKLKSWPFVSLSDGHRGAGFEVGRSVTNKNVAASPMANLAHLLGGGIAQRQSPDITSGNKFRPAHKGEARPEGRPAPRQRRGSPRPLRLGGDEARRATPQWAASGVPARSGGKIGKKGDCPDCRPLGRTSPLAGVGTPLSLRKGRRDIINSACNQHSMIDTHRSLRCGFPEVIFCQGKTPSQIEQIARQILKHHGKLLATRADEAAARAIKRACARAVYHKLARVITVTSNQSLVISNRSSVASKQSSVISNRSSVIGNRSLVTDYRLPGFILIITAGTSDIPVAEEARITAEMVLSNQLSVIPPLVGQVSHQLSVKPPITDYRLPVTGYRRSKAESRRMSGLPVTRTLYDVGVAGIHRVLAHQKLLDEARVIIVVAGMEGALASVVAGLVDKPVIAVPTSVGYGASFEGLAALLTMLNSCAAGVTVVNIDNGFGAGYAAALMMKTQHE